MAEESEISKKGVSADWLVRGILTRLGDTFDKFTGRRWTPSSSLATSELIERIKKLLDAEAKDIPGKGTVVPHNIKLRMQWDKFSTDSEIALEALQNELLVATVDHINDSLYYTYAPITVEVKPDYFIEGVKLMVSFEQFTEEDRDVEMNVTLPAFNVAEHIESLAEPEVAAPSFIARFELDGGEKEVSVMFPPGQSRSVGRTGGNDVVVDHSSVSKTHASLAIDSDGKLAVADTGSTNGTFVNDERIAYGKAISVSGEDRIRFGTVEVAFEYVPAPVIIADETQADDDDKVEVGGFEFRGRGGPQTPGDEVADDPTDDTATVATTGVMTATEDNNDSEANVTVVREAATAADNVENETGADITE